MRRMGRWIGIGCFAALPSVAWAQPGPHPHQPLNTGGITPQVGASGGDSTGLTGAPPVTNDTRTPTQEKARRLDQSGQPLPGDSATPGQLPNVTQPPPPAPSDAGTSGEMNPELNPSSGGKSAAPQAPSSDRGELRQQDQQDSDK